MADQASKVTALFEPEQPRDPGTGGVEALKILLAVAAARILALIAVIGGVGVWAWAVYDPAVLRLYAGAGYSLGVILPTIWLAWRKG